MSTTGTSSLNKGAPPQAAGPLSDLDKEIILAYAASSMSRNAVAGKLYMSHNTVTNHLNRIHKVTGLNPRYFFDLYQLVVMAAGTNVVEVIRCRDCEHSRQAVHTIGGQRICPRTGLCFIDDDYCRYGERRHDNERAD